MPTDQLESPNLQAVESILKSLAEVRQKRKGWFDSEEEVVEVETLAFKIGESLRPFLLAREFDPERFSALPLEREILSEDMTKVLASVKKKGFYPSPYSPIPDVDDQYTDFAAFSLEFTDLVYGYSQQIGSKALQKNAQSIARKALDFLIDPKNFLHEEKGNRWAGTNMYVREVKVKEYYTDLYFTSVVIIALRKVLERPVLGLSSQEKDEIRNLIRGAGKWIVGRSDTGLLTGDEKKNVKKLIYTTWGLRALAETFDTQEDAVKKMVSPIISAYVNEVEKKLNRDGVTLGQEYFTILSPSVEEPLYYEDRSDWGGIFLTLISLRKLPEIDNLLESTSYKQVLDGVYNGILVLRNPKNGLWYKDKFILSIHSYLTEGFLLYEKQAKDFGVTLNVTASMLRTAIRDTLKDDSIVSNLQQFIYGKLLQVSRQAQQSEMIDKGIKEITEGSRPSRADDSRSEHAPEGKRAENELSGAQKGKTGSTRLKKKK